MPAAKANRLLFEKSPYLRQHGHNPVDWYPWGEEAFEKARREEKLVFLSIGYSTCHWCHVMESESFEDEEVAALLNASFISVKVDREERPDLDHHYMKVCQMLTGSGGWPLTVVLTPDKRPLLAGTYFPKNQRYGRVGLMELLPELAALWATNRAGLLSSAEKVRSWLEEIAVAPRSGDWPSEAPGRAFEQLASSFDRDRGGFGPAPKFPAPHNLQFLLRFGARTGNAEAEAMVRRTLGAMRRGGIWDHLGFGFHRYSTDPAWLVPHFEKMLYDQALLAIAYAEAFQVTGDRTFRRTAEEILTYVLRDMTSNEGGFFSAEDADSEREEGKFYLWTEQEVRDLLSPADADLAVRAFGIERRGNFDEPGRGANGKNILHQAKALGELSVELGRTEEVLEAGIETLRAKLFAARQGRVPPLKDTKALTDWNGLMIAAMAACGRAFREERYVEAARRAAEFILSRLVDDTGSLLHRYMEGEAAIPAFLDDHAFLTWGLVELYEATLEPAWLSRALELARRTISNFWDNEEGGFFFARAGTSDIPLRYKELYDGALPSGNSVMMMNLLRLGRLTGNAGLEEKALAIPRAFGALISRSPSAHCALLCGLEFAQGPSYEVVIVGSPGAADVRAMLDVVDRAFLPNAVVLFRPEGKSPEIARLAPFVQDMKSLGGNATAYVCSGFRCHRPATAPEEIMGLITSG